MFTTSLRSLASAAVAKSSATRSPSRVLFSSYPNSLRAYPQYTVYGEDCMLSVKVLIPIFRIIGHNNLVVDNNKKGRILLEWTPRTADGGVNRENQLRFGLSPEEAGLILDQIPQFPVSLSRRTSSGDYGGAISSETDDIPSKVLHVTPGAGGVVSFKIDFELNGVGGQTPVGNSTDAAGPLEVTAQLGEVQVMREIMRTSMPVLVGWTTMMEIALQRSCDTACSEAGNYPNNPGYGGGSGYGGSGYGNSGNSGYGGSSDSGRAAPGAGGVPF